MTYLSPNPMICRSGAPLHWRAVQDGKFWHAELGITGRWSGALRWERVGGLKDDKSDAEKTAIDFAKVRAGRL